MAASFGRALLLRGTAMLARISWFGLIHLMVVTNASLEAACAVLRCKHFLGSSSKTKKRALEVQKFSQHIGNLLVGLWSSHQPFHAGRLIAGCKVPNDESMNASKMSIKTSLYIPINFSILYFICRACNECVISAHRAARRM